MGFKFFWYLTIIMDKAEQFILQLAEQYEENPDGFINSLENILPVPANEKGDKFSDAGNRLFNFSYFRLALASWVHALECFIQNKDREGCSAFCYSILSTIHERISIASC